MLHLQNKQDNRNCMDHMNKPQTCDCLNVPGIYWTQSSSSLPKGSAWLCVCRSVVTNCFDSKIIFIINDFLSFCIILIIVLETAMRLPMIDLLRLSIALSHFSSQRITSSGPGIILLIDCACIIRICKICTRIYQYKRLNTHSFFVWILSGNPLILRGLLS